MRFFMNLAILSSFVIFPIGVSASAATTLAVVPGRAKGGPNIKADVKKRIEVEMRLHASVMPLGAYKKAALQVGVRGKAIESVANAAEIGAASGLSHVLVITGIAKRETVGRRKKKIYYALVTVVRVKGNETIFAERFLLDGRRLSEKVASEIVAAVIPVIAQPEPQPEPRPEPQPTPEPKEPPPAPATPAPPQAPASPPQAAASAANKSKPEVPPASSSPSSVSPAPAATPPAPAKEAARSGRWRPGLQVAAGVAGFQRKGFLNAAGKTASCYCARDGETTPFFPGGSLQLDFFPFAFGGEGRWHEGLGLHVDYLFSHVTSKDSVGGEDVSSVYFASGGLSFRAVLWDSPSAIDAHVKLGYERFSFPLKEVAFPGTAISGFYVGLDLVVPLVSSFAITGGGHYNLNLGVGGGTDLLGAFEGGSGYRGQVGTRWSFGAFDITLAGRIDRFKLDFSGPTTAANVDTLTNASFDDSVLSGLLLLGTAL